MTHPNRRAQETEAEARRRKVAAALLAGSDNFTKIASELGVNKSTISRDVKAIEEQWRAEAMQDISAAKGRDLRRSERMIGAMWPKALNGDERAAKMVLDLMQHRARLLGLDAPKKVEAHHTMQVRMIADQMAEATGIDADELIAEAERILAEASAGGV